MMNTSGNDNKEIKKTETEAVNEAAKDKVDKTETSEAEKKDKNEVQAEGAGTKAEKADKDKAAPEVSDEEDADDGDLILANERQSVALTMQNARFTRSSGGLVSLELTGEDGIVERFERVCVLRAFPITNPDEFLSVREPDSKKMGRGKEIGMIRYISDFDEATRALLLEEMDRRYFSPQILKIYSVKEKFGYSYWDSETSAGRVTFILNNPFSNIRLFEDGRIFINDIDGNSFEISDPAKLDPVSFRKIELYL